MAEPRAVRLGIQAAAARILLAPADLDAASLAADDAALRAQLDAMSRQLTQLHAALIGLSLALTLAPSAPETGS